MKRWLKVGDRGCDALRKIGGNPTYRKMGGGTTRGGSNQYLRDGPSVGTEKIFCGPPLAPPQKKN